MYEIRLIENGRFVTAVGGPLRTLSDALSQIDSLCKDADTEALVDYVGCKWTRGGDTICALVVVNELGIPVEIVRKKEE